MKHKVLNVEGILKCFILILRQYNKQTWDFFDGPPSCKNSSGRTRATVAQLLSSPNGSPCARSHHIQLCSGLRLKPVSPCLLWGRPAVVLLVKSCLKQLVALQDEPVFFPFHSPQNLAPPDFFCCLIFQNHSSKTQTHLLCSQPKQCCFLFMTYHFPAFGGLQIWEREAAATLKWLWEDLWFLDLHLSDPWAPGLPSTRSETCTHFCSIAPLRLKMLFVQTILG